jgi:hypothetical protein
MGFSSKTGLSILASHFLKTAHKSHLPAARDRGFARPQSPRPSPQPRVRHQICDRYLEPSSAGLAIRRRFTEWLRRPGIGGMPSDPKVHPAPRTEFDDEEHIDGPEEQVNDRQKVTGPHLLRMILQERVPILGRRMRGPDVPQVGLEGGLGDAKTEFQEFAADPFGTPGGILGCHWLNQVDQVLSETGPTSAGATLEAPEEPAPLASPREQGVGFEDHKGLLPRAKAAREKQEAEAVSASETRVLDLALDAQRDELLTEQGILEQELGLGAQQIEYAIQGDGPLR